MKIPTAKEINTGAQYHYDSQMAIIIAQIRSAAEAGRDTVTIKLDYEQQIPKEHLHGLKLASDNIIKKLKEAGYVIQTRQIRITHIVHDMNSNQRLKQEIKDKLRVTISWPLDTTGFPSLPEETPKN